MVDKGKTVDEGRYWVTEDVVRQHGRVYRDWEGMSDPGDAVLLTLQTVHEVAYESKEVQNIVLDIVANLVYEYIDETGIEPTPEEIHAMGFAVHNMVTCIKWRKSDGKWTVKEDKEGIVGKFEHKDIGTYEWKVGATTKD